MLWLVSLADDTEEKDSKSEDNDLKDRANRIWDSLASEFDQHLEMTTGVSERDAKMEFEGTDLQDLLQEMEGVLGEMEEGSNDKGGSGSSAGSKGGPDRNGENVLDLQRVSFIRIKDSKDPLPLGALFPGSPAGNIEQEVHPGKEELEVRFLHPMTGAESPRATSIIRTLQEWRDRSTPLMASCEAMDLTYLYPLEIVDLELERSNRGCRALYGEIRLRKRPRSVKNAGGGSGAKDRDDLERTFLAAGYRMAMDPIRTKLGL